MDSFLKRSASILRKSINDTIDHTKLSSFKMLLFDCIPRKCRNKLNNSSIRCIRREHKYKVFEQGLKLYEQEINIVKSIRY